MSPITFEQMQRLSLSQLRRLRAFVDGLPEAAWNTQSACGEWQVGDVVAHLNGGAEMWAGLLPAMATGGRAPKAWALPNPSRRAATGDDSKALRRGLGDQALRRQVEENTAQLMTAIQGLRPEDSEKTSPDCRSGRTTVRDTLSVIVGETAIHQWDMESRVRPEALLPPEAFAVLMGYLAGWRIFGFQRGAPRPPVHYQWELSGSPPQRWDIVVRGDSFEHVRSATGTPDVLFRTDPQTYILVGMGRLDLRQVINTGRVHAEGPRAEIEAYASQFASM